jgi:hypothetical protein
VGTLPDSRRNLPPGYQGQTASGPDL